MGLRSLKWIAQRRGHRVGPLDSQTSAGFADRPFLLVAVALVFLVYAANFDFPVFRHPLERRVLEVKVSAAIDR